MLHFSWHIVLLIIALVLFLMASFGMTLGSTKIQPGWFGAAFFTLAVLLGGY